MSTQGTSSIANETSLKGNVTPFSALAPEPTLTPRQIMQANQQLQRQLDNQRLLTLFFDLCNKVTVVDGIELCVSRAMNFNKKLSLGELSQHKAKYNLSIDKHPLAILSFHRRKRFREQELANLEALQSALIYPLKHAILYEKALQESLFDPLTDCLNRTALDQGLTRETARSLRYNTPLSLGIVSLDHYSQIRDRHGFKTSYLALQECAKRLKSQLRSSDECFHIDTERFATLLHNTAVDEGIQVLTRVLQTLRTEPLITPNARIKLSGSIGIAQFEGSLQGLFEVAEQGLFKAQALGLDQIQTA